MTSLELLRKLGELPDWTFREETDSYPLCCERDNDAFDTWQLGIEGGQIVGGEALWGMLQEMRKKYEGLSAKESAYLVENGPKLNAYEKRALAVLNRFFHKRAYCVGSGFVIQAYIQWRTSQVEEEES